MNSYFKIAIASLIVMLVLYFLCNFIKIIANGGNRKPKPATPAVVVLAIILVILKCMFLICQYVGVITLLIGISKCFSPSINVPGKISLNSLLISIYSLYVAYRHYAFAKESNECMEETETHGNEYSIYKKCAERTTGIMILFMIIAAILVIVSVICGFVSMIIAASTAI